MILDAVQRQNKGEGRETVITAQFCSDTIVAAVVEGEEPETVKRVNRLLCKPSPWNEDELTFLEGVLRRTYET